MAQVKPGPGESLIPLLSHPTPHFRRVSLSFPPGPESAARRMVLAVSALRQWPSADFGSRQQSSNLLPWLASKFSAWSISDEPVRCSCRSRRSERPIRPAQDRAGRISACSRRSPESDLPCLSSPAVKNISVRRRPKSLHIFCRPAPHRGVSRSSRTRSGMRWTHVAL
jgi:hypothetical protein